MFCFCGEFAPYLYHYADVTANGRYTSYQDCYTSLDWTVNEVRSMASDWLASPLSGLAGLNTDGVTVLQWTAVFTGN